MPRVGKSEYGYDKKGREAAAAESERTGLPVVSKNMNVGPKEAGKRRKKTKHPLEMDVGLPVVGDVSIGAGPTDDFRGAKFGITKTFKEGGVVYSDARGVGKATRGTRYRG